MLGRRPTHSPAIYIYVFPDPLFSCQIRTLCGSHTHSRTRVEFYFLIWPESLPAGVFFH